MAQDSKDFTAKFSPFWPKDRLVLVLVGVGLLILIFGLWQAFSSSKPSEEGIKVISEKEQKEGEIVVDVSGAVEKSGVYHLPQNSRVGDAIKEAGGFSAEADLNFVEKSLNLAALLTDGAKLYIPKKGEKVSGTPILGVQGSASVSGQVNINTAPQKGLEDLPAIGPVTAAKIINGRPYSQVEDLINRKIVSRSQFEKIKDKVAVF